MSVDGGENETGVAEPALTEVRAVLFTDLVGSTELRVSLGEDDADELRRAHDELLGNAVAANNGHVVKGLGDGIMATFVSAADATAAAVAIQQAVDRHSRRRPDFAFGVRVGVSIGDVTLDAGDAFGVPVVEAARLCNAAKGGEILAADLVRALSRGRGGFTFEPIGSLELKGLPEPIPVCRLVWVPVDDVDDEGDGRVPFPGLLAIATIPYVGRADVLARLTDTRRQTAAGGARLALLSGEPGIGKTRTAAEIAHAAWVEGAVVLYGRCDEELAMPYQPFAEALDYYFANAPADDRALGRLPGELARLVPHLGATVEGLPPPVASDPRSEEHHLFESVASWITELASGRPFVLVLDDLQWATKPTLLLLLHAIRVAAAAGAQASLLVLATYRDSDIDRRHPLSAVISELRRLAITERLAIEGLSNDEVSAFISAAAGQELEGDIARLADSVRSETEGNPYFVAEVLRHLVETGTVQRKDDRWVVAPGRPVAIPEGVRDVIGRRLSRLSTDANELLSMASTIGRDFDVEVLALLSPATEDQILDSLDEAVRARLIDEIGADRYRFTSAMVRTTLYDELSATRKRRLHRRLAEALEKLRPDDVVALAHHFIEAGPEGGVMSNAVRYALAAGEQALEARALADAESQFRQALDIVDDDEAPERVAALCGLGISQRDQGDAQYRDTLLTAARLARAGGNDELLVRAALANSRGIVSVVGAVDHERLELIDAALAVVDDTSPDKARLVALQAAEVTFAGDHERRLALSDEAERLARDLGDPALLAWVLVRTGFSCIAANRSQRIVARATEATRLADGTPDPTLQLLARVWLSSALLTVGDYDGARRVTEEMLALAADTPPTLQWIAESFRVRFLLADGLLDEAHVRTDECFELGNGLGEPDALMWWGALVSAEARQRGDSAGEPEQVRAFADTYPGLRTWRVNHANTLAARGLLDEARAVVDEFELDPVDLCGDPLPMWGAYLFAELAYTLRDAVMAERTRAALAPMRGTWAHYHLYAAGPVEIAEGMCCLAAGRLDEAVTALQNAAAALHSRGAKGLLCRIVLPLAEALIARGSPGDREAALGVIEEARALATATGASGLREQAEGLAARLG